MEEPGGCTSLVSLDHLLLDLASDPAIENAMRK